MTLRLPSKSLRWKLVIGSALIEIVMLATLVVNNVRLIETSLQEQVAIRLQELSVLLNASIAPSMAVLDYGPIQGVFAENRRREGIVYFVLLDKSGRRLVSDGWPMDEPLPAVQEHVDVDSSVQRFDTDIPIGIGGQTYGQLQFGVSTEFLHQARENLLRQSILIALMEVLLSIVLLLLLGVWLTRHLSKLENASLAVGNGDFDVAVEVDSDDEIGRVGQAFNRMTHEIKQRLSELGRSEMRFRSLTELSADWYWEQDAELRFTSFQGGLPGRVDRLEQGMLGKRRWESEYILPSEGSWDAHKATLEARQPFRDLEYSLRTDSNEEKFIAVSGTPFYDSDGAFAGYRGIGKDITGRKQVESALIRSERVLRLSQQAASIGSYVIDLRSGHWESSQQFDEILGVGENFTRNISSWQDLLHPDNRERVLEQFQVSVANATTFTREYRIIRPLDGKTRWVVTWGDFECDNAGKPVLQIGAMQDITERKKAAEEIEQLAFYDPLTGLPNRRLLQDRLQHALANCVRRHSCAAVLLFDMDDFKTLNDTLGHDVGDQFLAEVASRMESCIREGDTVARLGGDEFVVILENMELDSAAAVQVEAVARKIQAKLELPFLLQLARVAGEQSSRNYHCTASIGIALFNDNSLSVDELMKRADTAMYEAKAAGRNTLRFFDPEMQATVNARAAMDSDLRAAVHDNEFLLHYQPQVNQRHEVIGAEALVRWQHPSRGLIQPNDFIPLAEETGLIVAIGNWVLEAACQQLVLWAAHPRLAQLSLAVNVSARQFRHPAFVPRILTLIAETGANPTLLKLELTESLLIDNLDIVTEKMTALKAHGVCFSLDDFGTGYSSLAYLKRLPLDQLKIDRAFVHDVLTNANDAAIARTIVALARNLGLAVIAEGVETEAQRDFLTSSGCDVFQGYFFSRPLPVASFDEFALRS